MTGPVNAILGPTALQEVGIAGSRRALLSGGLRDVLVAIRQNAALSFRNDRAVGSAQFQPSLRAGRWNPITSSRRVARFRFLPDRPGDGPSEHRSRSQRERPKPGWRFLARLAGAGDLAERGPLGG